ncbi:hypothetical protein Dip518_000496 [Parelusimicrobium proximum]|uniref:hypothetical protein n=1 Tax=Parelusimicrobium proximum TaxID=3228953 RepID=UPI003D167FA8
MRKLLTLTFTLFMTAGLYAQNAKVDAYINIMSEKNKIILVKEAMDLSFKDKVAKAEEINKSVQEKGKAFISLEDAAAKDIQSVLFVMNASVSELKNLKDIRDNKVRHFINELNTKTQASQALRREEVFFNKKVEASVLFSSYKDMMNSYHGGYIPYYTTADKYLNDALLKQAAAEELMRQHKSDQYTKMNTK